MGDRSPERDSQVGNEGIILPNVLVVHMDAETEQVTHRAVDSSHWKFNVVTHLAVLIEKNMPLTYKQRKS